MSGSVSGCSGDRRGQIYSSLHRALSSSVLTSNQWSITVSSKFIWLMEKSIVDNFSNFLWLAPLQLHQSKLSVGTRLCCGVVSGTPPCYLKLVPASCLPPIKHKTSFKHHLQIIPRGKQCYQFIYLLPPLTGTQLCHDGRNYTIIKLIST